MDVIVFFSWQSDSPQQTNSNAIRQALRAVASRLEKEREHNEEEFRIIIDEATRERPGSPNIPASIMEKIDACDIFVADCTTINPGEANERFRNPNPNVMFELGYAAARLGWERIIILFNGELGSLNDLPFDIDRQRISTYRFPSDANKDAAGNARASLFKLLSVAIGTIIEANPDRPGQGFDQEAAQRVNDLRMMRLALTAIHPDVFDAMYQTLPLTVGYLPIRFNEDLGAILESHQFHLYDQEALRLLHELRSAWDTCLDRCEATIDEPTRQVYVSKAGSDQDTQNLQVLHRAVTELLDHIRTHYLELDHVGINARARQDVLDQLERM